ncbi:MAG: hypothetical protein PVH19_15545, partial [Planctomycetia bacterium]
PASGSNTSGSQLAESKSAQAIPTETPPTDSPAVIKASTTEPVATPAHPHGPVDSEAFRLFEATPSEQHRGSAGWSTAP